jgi:hypothetical protein
MATGRGDNDAYADVLKLKRRKAQHPVSESEDEGSASDDDRSSVGNFNNPNAFLSTFGGYESDRTSDEDEQDEGMTMFPRKENLVALRHTSVRTGLSEKVIF